MSSYVDRNGDSECLASGERNGFLLSLIRSSRRRVTAEAFQSLVGWSDKYGFGIELMAYPEGSIPEGSFLQYP